MEGRDSWTYQSRRASGDSDLYNNIRDIRRTQIVEDNNTFASGPPSYSQFGERCERKSEIKSEIKSESEYSIRCEAVPEEDGILCIICCDYYAKSDIMTLNGCSHEFCKNCLADHLKLKINEGKVKKIPCIDYQCE